MHMDRAIFDLDTSVGATSLYILICALLDQGEQNITLERAMVQWNGTMGELRAATEELIRRGVLNSEGSGADHEPLQVNPRDKWH